MLKFRGWALILAVLLAGQAFFLTNSAWAEQDDIYIAIGGSYPVMRGDSWNGGKWGGTAKIGYFVARNAALQIEGSYLRGVKTIVDDDTDIYTAFLSAKGYVPDMKRITFTYFRPYIIAGIGGIHGRKSSDEYATDGAYKLGAGFDLVLFRHFSIELEANYTRGFAELSDAEFFNGTASAVFRF